MKFDSSMGEAYCASLNGDNARIFGRMLLRESLVAIYHANVPYGDWRHKG